MSEEKVTKSLKRTVDRLLLLKPEEFIGICKILGVQVFEINGEVSEEEDLPSRESKEDNQKRNANVRPREAQDLIAEVIDRINRLNRTQKRNLDRLLKAATKGGKDK